MKKFGKYAAVLVVMVAAIVLMGCKQSSGEKTYTQKYQVGDYILKDGTKQSKDETPEADTVAAVIISADTTSKPALGVGIVLKQKCIPWCSSSATGCSTEIKALIGDIESGYMDGSDSWEKVKAVCSDATDADASKYPAFEYCLNYATDKGFSEELATGWYLPTVAELKTIYDNQGIIDTSLGKAGGNQFGNFFYWSCCQSPSGKNYVFGLRFDNGKMDYYTKFNDIGYVCTVRTFK